MIDGIYNGAASLSSLEGWQNTISENLASSSAAGFKKTELSFEGVRSNITAAPNGNSRQSASMMPRTGSAINFSDGSLRETGKPTDFAISGPGFFQVRGAGNETVYTRDGEFHLNADNVLVTKVGREVIGEDGPVIVNPENGTISVGSDGTISQRENIIGKLTLREFDDPAVLQRLDGTLFAAPRGVNGAVVENPSIAQGVIETSNATPLSEMVNLVAVSRAYEATQKMITSHDENLRQAIQTLGGPAQG